MPNDPTGVAVISATRQREVLDRLSFGKKTPVILCILISLVTACGPTSNRRPSSSGATAGSKKGFLELGHPELTCRWSAWKKGDCRDCTLDTHFASCYRSKPSTARFFNGFDGERIDDSFPLDVRKDQDSYPQLWFVGHSTPARYSTFSNSNNWQHSGFQVLSSRLGVGSSLNRYAFLYSCRLFAHGPRYPDDYSSPDRFARGSEANVFSRWSKTDGDGTSGRPYGENLRLACGFSTLIDTLPGSIVPFLRHLDRKDLTIADSFVLGGLGNIGDTPTIPVCMTRSNKKNTKPKDTPLNERPPFLSSANAGADEGDILIEYPARAPKSPEAGEPTPPDSALKLLLGEGDESQIDRTPPTNLPSYMPVLQLDPLPLPGTTGGNSDDDPFIRIPISDLGPRSTDPSAAQLDSLSFSWLKETGLYYFSWQEEQDCYTSMTKIAPWLHEIWLARAKPVDGGSLLAASPARTVELIIDSLSLGDAVRGRVASLKHEPKAISWERQLLVPYGDETRYIPVEEKDFGELLLCSPSGPVFSRVFPSATIDGDGTASASLSLPRAESLGLMPIRTPESAAHLAKLQLEQLHNRQGAYKESEPSPRWAYKLSPKSNEKRTLYLYYIFDYFPEDPTSSAPRITIEVPAHKGADQVRDPSGQDGPSFEPQ